MPESFDGMLAELADAAAAATVLPDVTAVRRRAHERTVHRRMAASALALVLLGTCGGTVAAVSGRFAPRSQAGAIVPGATADVSSAASPPGAIYQGAAGSASDSAAAIATDAQTYGKVAGTWQLSDGGRYLIVFPDGGIGVGEAGAWQLCDGQLASVGSGLFYVDELACGDYGTTGLTLQSAAGGSQLSLAVPSRAGAAAYTVLFRRTAAAPIASTDQTILAKLVGEWSSGVGDERRVVVAGDGGVSLIGLGTGAGAGVVTAAGTVTGYYTDGIRVEIPCVGGPAASTPADCGVVELELIDGKQISVVGSYGAETFTLVSGSSSLDSTTSPVAPTGSPASTVSPDPTFSSG